MRSRTSCEGAKEAKENRLLDSIEIWDLLGDKVVAACWCLQE